MSELLLIRQVAHLSPESILVDDFTLGHEKEVGCFDFVKHNKISIYLQVPTVNEKFMEQLKSDYA